MKTLRTICLLTLGVLLATQNPVDLDYKGLANIGTWFLGRLQTARDRDRLMEGLGSSSKEGFDRARTEELLASLDKRVFLVQNVYEDAPVLFHTRWALSYLRGPLTLAQIKDLSGPRELPEAPPRPRATRAGTSARPRGPEGVEECFIVSNTEGGGLYTAHPRIRRASLRSPRLRRRPLDEAALVDAA